MMPSLLPVCCVAMLGLGCGGGKGGGSTTPGGAGGTGDGRTEIEVRRDAACEELGPRLTSCAIADARATMSAEELAKLDLEKTAPAHTEEFIDECQRQQLSSRQVRVYEVCLREESDCEALIACLDNVNAASEAP
jgi:hypothetical protein